MIIILCLTVMFAASWMLLVELRLSKTLNALEKIREALINHIHERRR